MDKVIGKCKFCLKPTNEEGKICAFCGYDPKTDSVSPDFNQQADSVEIAKKNIRVREKADGEGIDPRIKKFAFIGLVVVLFSIFYKNNFSITGVTSGITHTLTRLKTGKFKLAMFSEMKNKTKKTDKKIELINMGSFQVPQVDEENKDLVIEGISFANDSRSFVIISGHVIPQGESIDNITVKSINKDSVEVIVDGESRILRVHQSIPPPIKKQDIVSPKERLGKSIETNGDSRASP